MKAWTPLRDTRKEWEAAQLAAFRALYAAEFPTLDQAKDLLRRMLPQVGQFSRLAQEVRDFLGDAP